MASRSGMYFVADDPRLGSVWPSCRCEYLAVTGHEDRSPAQDDRLEGQLICTLRFLRDGPSNWTHGRIQAVLSGGDPYVENVLASFSAAVTKAPYRRRVYWG